MSATRFRLSGTAIGLYVALGAARGAGQALPSGALTQPTAPAPHYGTGDYSTTNVTAMAFFPEKSNHGYSTSPSFGRYGDLSFSDHYYASVDLPAGVVVHDIGFANLNDGTDAVMSATLWERRADGSKIVLASVSSTPHTAWSVDRSGAFDTLFVSHAGRALVLDVAVLPNGNPQYFGHVEVRWHRAVSVAPALATFTDVPANHPFFRFVEALAAAGITSGYPDGRFGIDDPITRGQMAVFLSTALGLHFPD